MALAPSQFSPSITSTVTAFAVAILALAFLAPPPPASALEAYQGMPCTTALNCDSTHTRLSCGAFGSPTPLTVCLCDKYAVGIGRNVHTVSPYFDAEIRKCVLPDGEPCAPRTDAASTSSVQIGRASCRERV